MIENPIAIFFFLNEELAFNTDEGTEEPLGLQ